MNMVERRVIKFDRAKVTKFDRHTDTVFFDLMVLLNGSQQVLKKQFKLSDSLEMLRDKIMEEVKHQFGQQSAVSYDDDDVPGNALVVVIQDYDEIEESLVNFFKRVKEKMRQFKSNRSAEGYLNLYSSYDNIEYTF